MPKRNPVNKDGDNYKRYSTSPYFSPCSQAPTQHTQHDIHTSYKHRQTDLQSEQTDTPQSTLSLSLQLKAADSSPHTYKRTTAHYNKPLHSKRFEGTSYSVMMEDSIILLNAGTIQQDCTASQPRRMHKHRHENSKYKPLQYSSHTQSVPPSIILTL